MEHNRRVNWALLTTNYGRTAMRVLKLYDENKLPQNVDIKVVIFQNTPSGAAEYAQRLGIETFQISRNEFNTRILFEQELLKIMAERNIDYIFLLGFSYLLKHSILEYYEDRIVNVHPSLLPSFKGHKAIQQAMEYGVEYSGITTHFIDKEVDKGKIISQLPIPFFKDDSFQDIDNRYMDNTDEILVKTFNKIIYG